MRLFVGIALAPNLTAGLTRLCASLRTAGDDLRWTPAESWHITLQFLGNATEAQFQCLGARLSEVRSVVIPVRLGRLNIFDRAGAFVVDVEVTPELVDLQKRVVLATSKCGFTPEDRPYHPHITLARAKGEHRSSLKNLKHRLREAPPLPAFAATEFLLYESHLGPGGAQYAVRERFSIT
jgi:RNA 2',3'-cyclic 3'-phosphodiesterase